MGPCGSEAPLELHARNQNELRFEHFTEQKLLLAIRRLHAAPPLLQVAVR
jgi:hypothetical protein